MQPGFSAITTSKYYHPAFNSAIFDGPIRIYFVQFHENYALKIYFLIQEQFKDSIVQFKEVAKKNDHTAVIMIYPTEDSFTKAFGEVSNNQSSLAKVVTGKEAIFGLLAPITENNVGQLMDELSDIFKSWDANALAKVFSSDSSILNLDAI